MTQKRILIPTKSITDWQSLLAKPDKHWRQEYSAMLTAQSWENAAGLPPEIASAFKSAKEDNFKNIELLLAIPEAVVMSVHNIAKQRFNPGAAFLIATMSAIAATIGDLLMLYVVNANAALNLPSHETILLPLGFFLGAFAIHLYGFGFWAIANVSIG